MHTEENIRELLASQRPGYSLEQRFYTDPEIYELEIDAIVTRNWIFAGLESQLRKAGDFLVKNVASESAIIVRQDNNEISAFANTCRHRGSLVCLESAGHVRQFACPYHGWSYALNGELTAARNMPDDFDKSKYGLHPVSVDVIDGLLFICFDANPPSLECAKRDFKEPMSMFDFKGLKVAAKKTYPIAANWKLAIENYQECYHCATAHPEYARMHTLMLDGVKRERVQNHMLDKMAACGLKRIDFDFVDTDAPAGNQGYGYSRTALFDGYKTGSRDGEPLAPLLGDLTDFDGGASDFTVGPFSFFLAYSDHVVGYVFTPIDHGHSECEIFWLVRNDAIEGTDYDRDELMWLWDVTMAADEEIIVNNWKGVNSRYYQSGPFSGMERAESRYIDWILQELRRATDEIR